MHNYHLAISLARALDEEIRRTSDRPHELRAREPKRRQRARRRGNGDR